MSTASFQFYGALNDFLPRARRHQAASYAFKERSAVKDMIEALGVPHPEVELILVGDTPVDFAYLVGDGDVVHVLPLQDARQHPALGRVPLRPPHTARFVLDAHLGKLARYLRMHGFDTLYRNDYDDAELAVIAGTDERILLSRDLGLLKRSLVVHGYFVRETDPRRQIVEILDRYDLWSLRTPFQRCTRCNGLLLPVTKEEVLDQLPTKTRGEYEEFRRCTGCARIYWRGSHFDAMQNFIDTLPRQ